MVLKTGFWAQKGGFRQMVFVHGESYWLFMVRISASKTVI